VGEKNEANAEWAAEFHRDDERGRFEAPREINHRINT
jgi:hypothetical protein